MAVRTDKMGQTLIISRNIMNLIPANHICFLIIATISHLLGPDVNAKYRRKPGCPAYPREMLLRVVVQAGVDGIRSSRKIAKQCIENVIYMHISGNEKPDFRTIARFRREESDLIKETFKSTVKVAKSLNILNLAHISSDGTKIKANASTCNSLSKEDIERIEKIIQEGIEIDNEEDTQYGDSRGDELPQELDNMEKIKKKIKEIEEKDEKRLNHTSKKVIIRHAFGNDEQKENINEKLTKAKEEIEKSGQKSVSITDPEARFMENKKKMKEISYSPQNTVDHGSGIIVANDVTQDCTDHHQAVPQIEETEKNVGKLPEGTKISNDYGFFSGYNLRYFEEKELDAYIPNNEQAQKMKGKKVEDKPYSMDKFEYDEEKDCFICPEGEMLNKKGEYIQKGKRKHAYYGSNCKNCTQKKLCAGKAYLRVLMTDAYEAERRRMKAKMDTGEGKEVYKQRGRWAEWPFGNIKQNLGFREFLTRGLKSAKNEYNLVCTSHNLRIIWNKIGRNREILSQIGKAAAKIDNNACVL